MNPGHASTLLRLRPRLDESLIREPDTRSPAHLVADFCVTAEALTGTPATAWLDILPAGPDFCDSDAALEYVYRWLCKLLEVGNVRAAMQKGRPSPLA